MKNGLLLVASALLVQLIFSSCGEKEIDSVTVPIVLDHNRTIVKASIQREDGTWRKVRLMIDTGNPEFSISGDLARDLGWDLSGAKKMSNGGYFPLEVKSLSGFSIGGKILNTSGIKTKVRLSPIKSFYAMHCDANLPSKLLMRYHVVFDYPAFKLTIAEPGSVQPHGMRVPLDVDKESGIVQLNAIIDVDTLSFALDNGASYSCIIDSVLMAVAQRHLEWSHINGAIGCANMWGSWPMESRWLVMRLPEIKFDSVSLTDVGMTGLPSIFTDGMDLGTWYSKKTSHPVVGFIGPNMLKNFRVEIDYSNNVAYFEKNANYNPYDMDIIGVTLNPELNGDYKIMGVVTVNSEPTVEGVEIGDILVQIDDLKTKWETMGTVIDALRGNPGDFHDLLLQRHDEKFTVKAKVKRIL